MNLIPEKEADSGSNCEKPLESPGPFADRVEHDQRLRNWCDLSSDAEFGPANALPLGMLLLVVAIGVGLATALISLDWFFANAEETDQSMAEWERPFVPWWATKFGIWLALSSAAGGFTYGALSYFFPKLFVPL